MRSTKNSVEHGRRSIGLLLLVFAAVVSVMSLPQVGAGFARMPGSDALGYVQRGYTLSEDGFERVIRSREHALQWADDPESLKELGLVYLANAQALRYHERSGDEPSGLDDEAPDGQDQIHASGGDDKRPDPRRRVDDQTLRDVDEILGNRDGVLSDADQEAALDLARRSVRLLSEGLAAAPGDPIHWTFLGIAFAELDDAAGVARALAGSHAAGAFSPEVAFLRTRLAFAYWDTLDERAHEQAKRDFVPAMRRAPAEFVEAARVAGRLLEAREAIELGLNDKLLERFELLMAGPASTS